MTDEPQKPITELLVEWRGGSDRALDDLMPLVYDELRRLAALQMRKERSDHTLQPTALVHEAFARLVDAQVKWQDRAHFLGVTTRIMRQVLVEHARARATVKRGGDQLRVTLQETPTPENRQTWAMVALDDALVRLAELDPRQARVVELRYIGGLKYTEIAEAVGVSEATIDRDLRHARAWLKRELKQGSVGDSTP